MQPTSTVTSVRNNSSIPPSPPSHSQLFFSRSVYRFASAEVRGELAPLVHSAGFEAGPTPLVYRLHGQHTVPLPCWPCCPRYYRRTHVDTFCLLMIEIEIIPARHRARTGRGIAAGQHRAASCKVGHSPYPARPVAFHAYRGSTPSSNSARHFVKRFPRSILRLSYVRCSIDSKFDAAFFISYILIHSLRIFLNFIQRKIGKRFTRNDNPCDLGFRLATRDTYRATYRNFHGNERRFQWLVSVARGVEEAAVT